MTNFKPEGWPTVMPRIFTRDVAGLARFVKAVFDAEDDVQAARPTELRIGDSIVMISGGDITHMLISGRTKRPSSWQWASMRLPTCATGTE